MSLSCPIFLMTHFSSDDPTPSRGAVMGTGALLFSTELPQPAWGGGPVSALTARESYCFVCEGDERPVSAPTGCGQSGGRRGAAGAAEKGRWY